MAGVGKNAYSIGSVSKLTKGLAIVKAVRGVYIAGVADLSRQAFSNSSSIYWH